jgi:hypothetical protein
MNIRWLTAGTAICLTLLLTGCLEVETSTTVHRDGSLARTVVLSSDSSGLVMGSRLFGIDSSWTLTRDTASSSRHSLTARREFANADEANAVLRGIPFQKLDIVLSLQKHFRWFVTTYRYVETWKRINPFNKVPLSDYLSRQEIELLRAGKLEDDSTSTPGDKLAHKEVGKRADEWLQRNAFEEYFQILLEGVRALGDPSLLPDSVSAARKRIYAEVGDSFAPHGGPVDTAVERKIAALLKNPAVLRAFRKEDSSLAQYNRASAFFLDAETPSYTVSAVMPGLITNTNATSVEGSRVGWKDFLTVTYFDDAEMWVESSAVNWWAIVATGLLLIGIGTVMVIGLIRHR